MLFKLEESSHDFLSSAVKRLFELHVSLTVMDFKSIGTRGNWKMSLSLSMMDMKECFFILLYLYP